MRNKLAVVITGLFVAGAIALADDNKKTDDKKPVQPVKKARPELEDALKRAFKRVREMDDYRLLRFHLCTAPDREEGVGVLCFAELGTGDLVLILASKSQPELDQYILIEKASLEQLDEAVQRSKRR